MRCVDQLHLFLPFVVAVIGRKPILLIIGYFKKRVLHSQGIEYTLLQKLIERHARQNFHQVTLNIDLHAVAIDFARMTL